MSVKLASASSVLAAWEILGTLMNGGTLCIRNSNWNDILSKVVASVIILIQKLRHPVIG